jgi:ATP-binding protein involved in chromosome partitioning
LAADVVPKSIRRLGGRVEFDWDGIGPGGHVSRFGARALRLACPCAACVEEMSGRPILDPATVPEEVQADAIDLVGAYGIRVHWSDGHATGIYTFRGLREACPCPACQPDGD